jgi:hypothetical protein
MGQETKAGSGGIADPGESPDTLSRLQIILAHLLVVGIPLALLSSQMPAVRTPLILMVVAAGLGLLAGLLSLGSARKLRPFEWTSLAMVLLVCAALAGYGFGGLF